jgi:hypothetical protein
MTKKKTTKRTKKKHINKITKKITNIKKKKKIPLILPSSKILKKTKPFFYWTKISKKKRKFMNSKWFFQNLNNQKHFLQKKKKLKFKFKFWRRYKKLISIRYKNRAIPSVIRHRSWETPFPNTEKRINWLTQGYEKYQLMSKKKSYQFFKGLFGYILLKSYKKLTKFKASNLFMLSWQKEMLNLSNSLAQAWWYENIRNQIKESEQLTITHRAPIKHLSHLFWTEDIRKPWLSPLIFKRGLINAMLEPRTKENKDEIQQRKIYKRFKSPTQTKKFNLYQWYENLLSKKWLIQKHRKKKIARFYQIITKVVSPFYGHLKKKQFKRIWHKNKKIKSYWQTQSDNFFATFERRLDILVYRLNYAPTILWARRLIWEGAIFVSNFEEMTNWSQMYSHLKIYNFPLRLRDPKNIYCYTYWNPSRNYSKNKFFLEPIIKENYKVKLNEIIQYNPHANNNLYKIKTSLFQKGIQKNTLIGNSKIDSYNWKRKAPTHFHLGIEKQEILQTNTSLLIFNPQYNDLTNKQDRIQESFLNWIIL